MTTMRPRSERLTPDELHKNAVFGGMADDVALNMLDAAQAGYRREGRSFDRARALRELAKLQCRTGSDRWEESINLSESLLYDEQHYSPEAQRPTVAREIAATRSMKGRMLLAEALRDTDSNQEAQDLSFYLSSGEFGAARQYLKKASSSPLPDQYEINFATANIIAKRYSGYYGRPVFSLAKAAITAPMSEPRLARHNNASLSLEERKAARKRSLARVAFAAGLVFRSNSYIHRPEVRQRALKMVL